MPEDSTINALPQPSPRQERLQLVWDGQTPPAAPAPSVQPAARPEPVKAEAPAQHFPLTPKSSPFRTASLRPAPPADTDLRQGEPSAPVPAGTGAAPHLVNRLRTVGRILRESRDSRQYSISQVSQKTKIPREFIENIENQVLADLPKPVYTKSYIRQLCREYGLDAAPLLEEYRIAVEGGAAPAAADGSVKPDPSNRKEKTPGTKAGPAPRPRPTATEEQYPMKKFSPAMIAVIIIVLGLVALALVISAMNKGKKTAGGADIPADKAAQVDMTKYITPQQLSVKELAVPNSTAPAVP